MVGSSSHFANSVRSALTGDAAVYATVQFTSLYQPLNTYPALVGFCGRLQLSPAATFRDSMLFPPFVSKATVIFFCVVVFLIAFP